MRQKIYPDPHGIEAWDESTATRVFVHLVAASDWKRLTGHRAPRTPVSAKLYAQHGLPWFDLDDEGASDLSAPEELIHVTSIAELAGLQEQDVDTPPPVVHHHAHVPTTVVDGHW